MRDQLLFSRHLCTYYEPHTATRASAITHAFAEVIEFVLARSTKMKGVMPYVSLNSHRIEQFFAEYGDKAESKAAGGRATTKRAMGGLLLLALAITNPGLYATLQAS